MFEHSQFYGKRLPDTAVLSTTEALNKFKKVLSFLTVSSLFVAGTGFFQTFAGFVLMGIEPHAYVCISVFLMTFSVYSLNKLTDIDEDAINTPDRLKFLQGRKKLVLYYSLCAYAVSALLAVIGNLSALPVVFIPIMANAVYSSRLIPGTPRLKDIPVMKNVVVALSWSLVCTLMPALHAGETPTANMIAPVLYFMIARVFINTVTFDIRDVEGDRQNKVITIPVLLGTKNTALLLLTVNSTLIPLLFSAGNHLLAQIMVLYGYIFILYFRKRRNPLALDLFVDGEWMIACLLFLIIQRLG